MNNKKEKQWGSFYPLQNLSEDVEQLKFCIKNDKYAKSETLEVLDKLQNKIDLTIDYYKNNNNGINIVELEHSLDKWQRMYYKKLDCF